MAVSSATSTDPSLASSAAAGLAGSASTSDASDRFLKLLVAQMQNQDPLNPMDNAQVTSQMAQINTVTGIEKLNGSVNGLSAQFVQMQALQGASLVGHDVIVPGNKLDVVNGVAQGGYSLTSAATNVDVQIMNGAGVVVGKLSGGAESAGLNSFNWDASQAGDGPFTFKVVAKSGAATIDSTPLMRDRVTAVSMQNNQLQLELAKSGSVAYGDVKAFN